MGLPCDGLAGRNLPRFSESYPSCQAEGLEPEPSLALDELRVENVCWTAVFLLSAQRIRFAATCSHQHQNPADPCDAARSGCLATCATKSTRLPAGTATFHSSTQSKDDPRRFTIGMLLCSSAR